MLDFADLLGRGPRPDPVAPPSNDGEKMIPPAPPRRETPKIPEDFAGILELDADAYHADPCASPSLSASIASVIDRQSLAHAWAAHPRLGGVRRQETESQSTGSLLHALLLGEADRIDVIQADDWRTKAARELRAEAKALGRVPVLEREYDQAAAVAVLVAQGMAAKGVSLDPEGASEVTVIWHETASDGTRVQCRGRIDHLALGGAHIIDLKSSMSAHPDAIRKHVEAYGYAIQRAAYVSAIEKLRPRLAGRVEFTFVFFETTAPHAVTPVRLDGAWREIGERRWRRAVDLWAQATRTNEWPDYASGIATLDPPGWLLAREERRMAEEDLDDEEAASAAE